MKICGKCNVEKELSEFHKKGKSYQYMCKECRKIYIRKHYENNKDNYLKSSKNSREKAFKWYRDYKSTLFCKICGEDHPACLDFHHRNPNEKEFVISSSVNALKREKFLEEIAKCDVLCANCHRKLHYNKE